MALNDWPTLGAMIDSGKRVVVFLDNGAESGSVPYLMDEFTNMWEDPYSELSCKRLLEHYCRRRGGMKDGGKVTRLIWDRCGRAVLRLCSQPLEIEPIDFANDDQSLPGLRKLCPGLRCYSHEVCGKSADILDV